MINMIDFLVSDEAMLVYLIAFIISMLYIIFYFIKKTSEKRKLKHNTLELKKLSNEVIDVEKEEKIEPPEIALKEKEVINNDVVTKKEKVKAQPIFIEKKIDNNEEKKIEKNICKDEKLIYTDIEPTEEEAVKELEEITEKLEYEEAVGKENIELTEFERMQEDTAIISLEELMKKASELYEKNEETQYKDDGDVPITIQEFEQRRKKVVLNDVVIKDEKVQNKNKKEEKKTTGFKFKSSPFISPIYGIEKPKNNDICLENTADYDKFDDEIRKTENLIESLKEYQHNID